MKFRIGKGSTNAANSYVCVCEIFEVAPHKHELIPFVASKAAGLLKL